MTSPVVSRAWLLALAFCWMLPAAAQLAVPPLKGRVTDQVAMLTAAQAAALEQRLQAFEAKKGSQVAVLIVASTAPESIEQYALRVVEQWKLGRKKVDDGALLLIAKNDRTLRIEVGYGLEGALNDATSKRIISETITPLFQQGKFPEGIDAGVDRILRVIDGEPLPAPAARAAPGSGGLEQIAPILLVVALVGGGILRAALGRLPGALVTAGAVGAVAWWLVGAIGVALIVGVLAFLMTLFGSGRGGRGMAGLPGISGAGGSRGGGFSGGGGSFGGGGASGRW